MTAHSKYGRYIRNVTNWMWAASGGWMDAGQCEAFVNNLAHLQDQATDFLWNYNLPAGESFDLQVSPQTWRRAPKLDRLVFPLHIIGDGGTAYVQIRIRGAVADVGNVAYIVLGLSARESNAIDRPTPGAGDPSSAATLWTSTSNADQLVTLRLSRAQLDAIRRQAPTREAPTGFGFKSYPSLRADGSLGAAEIFEAQLSLWVWQTNQGGFPIVAFSGREYVGP